MGYSHYWGRVAEIPQPEFAAWLGDVQRIVRRAKPRLGLFGGIRVNGPAGFGRPRLEADVVSLNGSGLFGGVHETFVIHRRFADYRADAQPSEDGLLWDAVKTNQKPYDAVVIAALLAFIDRVVSAQVTTDGDRDAWRVGTDVFQHALERDPASSLARVFRSKGT